MKRTTSIGPIALAGALALALPAAAGEIAWNEIIGAEPAKLTGEQKQRVTTNLKKLNNTRGCTGTIAGCMAAGDVTARRHAGFVVRMVRKGKDDSFIARGIADRDASAHPQEIFDINLADRPRTGGAKAKVEVVEFACFQCPFCAHLAPKMKGLKKLYGNKVAHYYKFFPVRSHARGVATALAGLAAHRQGRFWRLHDLMYENRTDLSDEELLIYAKEAGLDPARFEADLADASLMRAIEKDKLEGMRLGVEGTPTFFINGKLFQGVYDHAEIMDRIAEELDIVEGRIR